MPGTIIQDDSGRKFSILGEVVIGRSEKKKFIWTSSNTESLQRNG